MQDATYGWAIASWCDQSDSPKLMVYVAYESSSHGIMHGLMHMAKLLKKNYLLSILPVRHRRVSQEGISL